MATIATSGRGTAQRQAGVAEIWRPRLEHHRPTALPTHPARLSQRTDLKGLIPCMPTLKPLPPSPLTRSASWRFAMQCPASPQPSTSSPPMAPTATAVCSVTDQPPTLLVCINRSASVYETFIENGLLCVNTLGNGQQDLSNLFGGKRSQQERFDGGQWESGVTGAPILNSAKLALDCKVTQSVSVGTHDILFCQVLDIRHQGESDALVYFARQYHHLPSAAPAA
ncbi:FMN reductase RutF [Pseudomonas syringae pv. daphniphylli]|uniref:FMN reductase RutF n=1 Tax=Pseudomonas syringae pv. daphniphylli TaxID=264455 RepID=A0A9X0H357_PSESX|nr:FMN reductase RutF [Pseudomonas syringae pv. daphniphylli]